MSTLLIFVAAMLACIVIAGWWIKRKIRPRHPRLPAQVFAGATTRKLSSEERSAIESYLETLSRFQDSPTPTGAIKAPVKLTLTQNSGTVYSIRRAITRYGLSSDDPNKWRYYLDSVEVHLPPFCEQYITDDNSVELIRTATLPLVISLNGHSLQEHVHEARGYVLEGPTSGLASIRGEESEQIELLNIRQETQEEHALGRPDGLREALLICASFVLFFLCLVTPPVMLPWLAGVRFCSSARACGGFTRRRRKRRCAKFTVCAARRNAGACLAKPIRNSLIIFRLALSISSIRPTGSRLSLTI